MIGLTKKTSTGRIPVFGPNAEQAPGGYVLVTTGLAPGTVIAAATPLVLDDTARTATVVKTAVMNAVAGATATTYQVNKGQTFAIGDYVASGGTAGKAYAITAIDTSNAAFDVLTVGTSIGAAASGDLLYQSTATGTNVSALPPANGLLYEETMVPLAPVKVSVSAVIRGTVYARRVPYNAAIASLYSLRNIIYIQSH